MWDRSYDPAKPAMPPLTCAPPLGAGALSAVQFQPLPQLTIHSPYHSQPVFRAVEIGPDQNLPVAQVTGNSQELQMQNGSR